MDKTQILSLIREKIKEGIVDPQEVRDVADSSERSQSGGLAKNITNIFYIIGALIVLVGALILIAQYWDEIGFFGRMLSTAGIALVTYLSSLFMKDRSQNILSQALFTLSAVLAPVGIIVYFREFEISFASGAQSVAGLCLGLIFLSALLYAKKSVLTLITTLFFTWSFFALVGFMFPSTAELAKWTTMITGIAYVLIGYHHRLRQSIDGQDRTEGKLVENILYLAGTVGILAPALFLNGLFDLLSVALIFAAFYASTFIRSRAMLMLSSLFLMIYVFKMTAKYFSDSIGWPLSLIAIGFAVICVGYVTLYLNQKYIIKGTRT